MKSKYPSGNEIRQSFIDFFVDKGHHFVRSSSLVPGGDSTLLFTNAGMVQFKDVFLGTDKRDYSRAANSQKCMRVAGKHNDLDDVGRDDTHHTFFEMMGNWSFGDYDKKEAISWAWELLTDVWGLPKDRLYATVFKDELGEIPTDEEAVGHWLNQPGFNPDHLFYLGRKENFWEMGDTGPCGPCSEIHYDLRPDEGPVDMEGIESDRFVELWNLVFMQYNRRSETRLDSLPETHIDTGLGLERTVAVLQGGISNYRTDLMMPLIKATQQLTGHTDRERDDQFTPYRVIADHARAAAFLIADGVVPGNLGRNYVCRMIIRRGYRFGGHLGLQEPFLARIASVVIDHYSEAYPELERGRSVILNTVTREEEQFQRTLANATHQLETLLDQLSGDDERVLSGEDAADLYTTYGMPLEITRDIARERGLEVDEEGFHRAMEEHRLASGGGKAMGEVGGGDVDIYRALFPELRQSGKLGEDGVEYDPYHDLEVKGEILALISGDRPIPSAELGDPVRVIVPRTPFYIEAGGQVSDTGTIKGENWTIEIEDVYQPAAGMIAHRGVVVEGKPRVGDAAVIRVEGPRRKDIMRNHTGTHLLHAALDQVVGEHARQAGSSVAPDHLRFDFTHTSPLTDQQIEEIESLVNRWILEDHSLNIKHKPIQQAVDEGARALFGEKYGEVVRTIKMGDFSYELCGGTHCQTSGEVGLFLITSEGSAAAGIRRIEAVTGRGAFELVQKRFLILKKAARVLSASPDEVAELVESTVQELSSARKEMDKLRRKIASVELIQALEKTVLVGNINLLTAVLDGADMGALLEMGDRFRQKYPAAAVAVLGSVRDGSPIMVAVVTEDLVEKGIKAGDLVQHVASQVGGGGGGRPTLAQAGGKHPEKLNEALNSVQGWLKSKL